MMNLMLSMIFFACLASLVASGLWNNALMLINVIIAALIATNYYEPLATWLDGQWKSYTYLWDFVALWAIFAVSMIVLRTATDQISTVRVRFRRPLEIGGGIFFACCVAWTMVCFTTMTLHTAPLAQNFMRGGFQPTPQSRMFFGLAPDQKWLGFMQAVSNGSLSKLKPNPFDPKRAFISKYGWRRAEFEKQLTTATK